MLVPWSIAKVCLTAGNTTIRALRAYVVLASTSDTFYASNQELADEYLNLGLSRATFYKDLKAISHTYSVDARNLSFVETCTLGKKTLIHRRAMSKVCDDMGVAPLGMISVSPAEIADFHLFKRALIESVLFGQNRDERGGVTLSYAGMEKLVNMSGRQLKRVMKKLDIRVQANYADVLMPDPTRNKFYAHKQFKHRLLSTIDSRAMIRIRNTYYSDRHGEARSVTYEKRGTPASESTTLRPEFGEWAMRQTWADEMPTIDQLTDMLETVDVDLRIGTAVLSTTGELVGWWSHFMANANYRDSDLSNTLKINSTVDRNTALQSHGVIYVR